MVHRVSNITQLNIHLLPGNTYEIEIPRILDNNMGYFDRKESVTIDGEPRPLMLGFVSVSKTVGKLIEPHATKFAVMYEHIYPADNVIWFYALTGERVKITIQGTVPVHNHSAINLGGPAYGTYYSQPEVPTQ